jgi:hypothetical protein
MPTYIQDSKLDIVKIVENIICLIDTEEAIVFNGQIIDDQFVNLFKKSMSNLIETYTFFIRNKHIS